MRNKRSFLIAVLSLLATCAIAQVAVVESDITSPEASSAMPATTSSSSKSATTWGAGEQTGGTNNANTELYYQLEFLQQEVQALRGVVEELTYQMKQLKQEQKDRYLDLDRRLSQANTQNNGKNTSANSHLFNDSKLITDSSSPSDSRASSVDTQTVSPSQSNKMDQTSTNSDNSNTGSLESNFQIAQNESDIYRAAYHLLLRKKAYQEAIESFKSFLVQFPDGKYAANAHYWLGEAYLVENDLGNAKGAFSSVISRFPSHRKAPGAMYKLGTTYFLLNDMVKAKELLQQVSTYYPGSSAAKLASQYIRDHSIR